jgi:hypothetical protein
VIHPVVVEIVVGVNRDLWIELKIEIFKMLMPIRDGAETDVIKIIHRHIDILESV